MSTETGTPPATAPQPPTENQAPRDAGEISSFARYVAARQASSAADAKQPAAGEGAPSNAQPSQSAPSNQPDREQFIPRSRFDEVLQERNALRQMAQTPPPQNTGYAPQANNTGMQVPPPVQQYQPQGFQSPTGMVGQYAQPQQPQGASTPDFTNPDVQKEWQAKIAKNPVTGLREFVSLLIQTEGGPLLEQFRQQISQQVAPLQQSYLQQQLSTYTTQRQQADPSFGQVAPTFNQLVSQAVQRGYQLNPQVLQAIEGIARAQSGQLSAPAPRQVPFSEAPGGTGSFGEASEPNLTPEQLTFAKRFDMTPAEYAASLRSYRG